MWKYLGLTVIVEYDQWCVFGLVGDCIIVMVADFQLLYAASDV